jgi:hypothetical protein
MQRLSRVPPKLVALVLALRACVLFAVAAPHRLPQWLLSMTNTEHRGAYTDCIQELSISEHMCAASGDHGK